MEPGPAFCGVPHFVGCLAFWHYRSRSGTSGFDGRPADSNVVLPDPAPLRSAFRRIFAGAVEPTDRCFVRRTCWLPGGIAPDHAAMAARRWGAGCDSRVSCGELDGEPFVADCNEATGFQKLISRPRAVH